MEHLYEKASASAAYLKEQLRFAPRIAVVLGSGLGDLTAGFTDTREIPYADIPHFPQSTVAGHKGALLEGKLGDTPVLAMEGRFHFYEGYTMKEVCYPFYVFKLLGIETVVLTNAAGGINRSLSSATTCWIWPGRWRTGRASRTGKGSTWALWAPATRRPPRSAPLRPWAPTPWG